MDFLLSVTGSGARVVRDAISQRLWPGPGQQMVPVQARRARSDQGRHINVSLTGWCAILLLIHPQKVAIFQTQPTAKPTFKGNVWLFVPRCRNFCVFFID